MDQDKKTLFVGAHPDDVFLACAITIKRRAKNSYVLTVCNGVIEERNFPLITGGLTFNSPKEYAKQRLEEDRKAMESLGLDLDSQYINLQTSDLKTYLNLKSITDKIEKIVREKEIQIIVTHEIPQSHPDHEVACFCAHYVAQKLGLEVWEYPLYGYGSEGTEVKRQFLSKEKHNDVFFTDFTTEEVGVYEKLMKLYKTQDYILGQFKGEKEKFGRIKRDFSKPISEMKYLSFFKEVYRGLNFLTPGDVRVAILNFLKEERMNEKK